MPILEQFQPQIILVSCGFDASIGHPHPLGGYELTPTCKTKRIEVKNKSKIELCSRFCLYDKKINEFS